MERSPWALLLLFYLLFLLRTPNPLLNAFKPIPLRWVGRLLFSFAFFFLAFSSPNSQPSSLREKGPSLR